MRRLRKERIRKALTLVLAMAASGLSDSLRAEVIDDIRISKIGDIATIEVEFLCGMQFLHQRKTGGGTATEIKLSPQHDCRVPLLDKTADLRRPMSGHLADLSEIEFVRNSEDGDEQAFLVVRFNQSLLTTVSQTSNSHMLTIEVDRRTAVNVVSLPQETDLPAEVTPTSPAKPVDREITRRVRISNASDGNRYAIRLMRWNGVDELNLSLLDEHRQKTLYTNHVEVAGRQWSELKLGFFATEAAATRAQEQLSGAFSLSWITVATPAEQAAAAQTRIDTADPVPHELHADATIGETQVLTTDLAVPKSSGQVAAMMGEARTALTRRDYNKSIEIYEELLQYTDGGHHPEAREYLGVARQKSGQPDLARVAFESFLDDFPDDKSATRVRQRLAAISVPDKSLTRPDSESGSLGNPSIARAKPRSFGWEFVGNASQYYLRGVNLGESINNDYVAQSALLSEARVIAHRRGQRYDLTAQANLGYLYDFEDANTNQQALVSYAFLDIVDTKRDANIRIGRQRQLLSGVLSRFDGLHASYQYRDDIRVNVTAGFPVDSRRYMASSDHYSYGASIDLDNLIGNWDFSVYANQQMVDGIKDRQALGAEALYQGRRFSVVGLFDYDASYNIINTALLNATWRAHDRVTLHGRVRSGVAPFLTTRNAIIGQSVNTVRELFDDYSEGQIRRLARNRTVDERFASGGITAALTPRLQLRLDTSYLEYSATVASGGVEAIPASGPQYSYGGHLQGSGLFSPGQIMQIGYRHMETSNADTDTFWLDWRFPFRERLRLRARLSLANRIEDQNPAGNIDNWVINPLLSVVYSGERRYRIEFEAGGRWSNREFPSLLAPPLTIDDSLEQQDYYLRLGYTLDF